MPARRVDDMKLTDDEFRMFSDLIAKESGILIRESRRDVLHAKLQKRLQASQINSLYRYYKFITDRMPGNRELSNLIDSLTIHETSFFRNKPQFDLFADLVIPDLKRRNTSSKKLRLWSAGCSHGQEPYSMAMSLLSTLGFPLNWDVQILASDISRKAIETAQQGSYSEQDLEEVQQNLRSAFFERTGDGYHISQHVKNIVLFGQHNLKRDSAPEDLHVIFCRNVMIYFDAAEQNRLIEKFFTCLRPGGYLFLGHSETLIGVSDKFTYIHSDKAAVYQKKL